MSQIKSLLSFSSVKSNANLTFEPSSIFAHTYSTNSPTRSLKQDFHESKTEELGNIA